MLDLIRQQRATPLREMKERCEELIKLIELKAPISIRIDFSEEGISLVLLRRSIDSICCFEDLETDTA